MTRSSLKERLRRVVEEVSTPGGRRFDLAVQALILLSMVVYSLETLPGIDVRTRSLLQQAELWIVGIFTLEYLLRVWVAAKKREFVFSFFGLVDLAAILPFYLALGLDLEVLRACRLLRLLRIFKLFRYSRAARRYRLAFSLIREELALFFSAAFLLLFFAAAGVYHFEHEAQPEAFQSIFHSLWWAVITLTTVGYGDAYPVTLGGRLFTFLVLMIGLGVVSVPSGLMASSLSEARRQMQEETADEGEKAAGS